MPQSCRWTHGAAGAGGSWEGQVAQASFACSWEMGAAHHWRGRCPASRACCTSWSLQRPWAGSPLLGRSPALLSLGPAYGSENLFPESALYSGFIFRGSANKFLPNCPQTKKVHISALKVTGGIADQAWHICRPPPAIPTICSHGHPPPQFPASSSESCPSIFPTSLLTLPSLGPSLQASPLPCHMLPC